MKTKAFTLLEILIVIGIIALLAAILFPAFGRVREAGRRTTCASNLKQISLAFNQYAQDYKFYPVLSDDGAMGNAPAAPGTPCGAWPDKMLSYIKEKSIFVCPSDSDHHYDMGCPPDDTSDSHHPITYRGSYSFNEPHGSLYFNPATDRFTGGSTRGASPMRYTRPSSTILISDGVNYSWGGYISPGYTQPPPTDVASLSNYGVPNRHSGGINVAFADGHVKWMSLDSLLKLSLWRINGPE